jgi:hypothetical protein
MIADLDETLNMYGGLCVHDATGIGNVVDDLITYDKKKVKPVVLRGRERESVFTQYIAGIEQDGLRCPRIKYVLDEHKYVTDKDLFGSGHPPDSFIAGALAWSIRRKAHRPDVRPLSITRQASPWTIGDNDTRISKGLVR